MAAKRAPKPAPVGEPPSEACKAVEPAAEGEAPGALVPPVQPVGSNTSAAPSSSEEVQRMRVLAEIAGRVYRALTACLKAEQRTLRVLGVITWLVLLVSPASLVVVFIVLAFRWDPLHTILLVTGSTGLVAGTNLIGRRWGRGK
jgi:hypothetical protein